MTENKSRRVGVINFVGQIEIPAEAVSVAVKANLTTVGRHLLVDLKGVRDFPIPPNALLSVETKDNILNEPNTQTFRTWGDIDRSMTVRAAIDDGFYASRTSIRILFVDPTSGCIIAATPRLHAADETGNLKNNGESYIKFRREVTQTLPAKPCVEIEGPVIEFGASGPADVAASENDLGFVQYGLPAAISQFTASMLLAEDGYDTQRWNKFKSDAADWAGLDDWAALRKEFISADKPELALATITNKVVAGLMSSRAYKERLKALAKSGRLEETSVIKEHNNDA